MEDKKKAAPTQQPLKEDPSGKDISDSDIQNLANMSNPYGHEERAEECEPGTALVKKEDKALFEVSEHFGIDKNFLLMMGPPGHQTPFVTSAGLAYKADLKGVDCIQSDKITELKDEKGTVIGYECTAYLWPHVTKSDIEILKLAAGLDKEVQRDLLKNILKPYTAVGTATKANLSNTKMHPWLKEMAQTRAINRVKRQFVAFGLTSIEEMPEYTGDEAGDK